MPDFAGLLKASETLEMRKSNAGSLFLMDEFDVRHVVEKVRRGFFFFFFFLNFNVFQCVGGGGGWESGR